MARYTVELRWTSWGGAWESVRVTEDSWEAAWGAAIAWAQRDGWTPRRWWQVWRRRDTRIPVEYASLVEEAGAL